MTEFPKDLYTSRQGGDALGPRLDRAILRATTLLRLRRWIARHRYPMLFVVLPTLITGFYFFFIAADQYETEAHFVVHSSDTHSSGSSMLQQMLQTTTGGAAVSEQYSVGDYLVSHDAVQALMKQMDLVAMFRTPGADPLARLWYQHPTDYKLLKYYRGVVNVYLDSSTGITTLRVRGFRAADTYRIATALLELGEKRVNDYNGRAEQDTMQVARDEVARAEKLVLSAQQNLTQFRLHTQDIDPEKSATSVLTVMGGLEKELADTRAQLASTSAFLDANSPQRMAMNERAKALEDQIHEQGTRLTGNQAGMASKLSDYEQLLLEKEIADREYTVSLDSLKTANLEAVRQHLFVSRVVEPNMPGEAEYPRRIMIVLSVLAILLVTYGIGWLIVAGTKEHAG
jgi:capsular polysaccharide transport system permease protein